MSQQATHLERDAARCAWRRRVSPPRCTSSAKWDILGLVRSCGCSRLGRHALLERAAGYSSTAQTRSAAPIFPPRWRCAPLWTLLLGNTRCLSGQRDGGHLHHTRHAQPAPILPPRWRRAALLSDSAPRCLSRRRDGDHQLRWPPRCAFSGLSCTPFISVRRFQYGAGIGRRTKAPVLCGATTALLRNWLPAGGNCSARCLARLSPPRVFPRGGFDFTACMPCIFELDSRVADPVVLAQHVVDLIDDGLRLAEEQVRQRYMGGHDVHVPRDLPDVDGAHKACATSLNLPFKPVLSPQPAPNRSPVP